MKVFKKKCKYCGDLFLPDPRIGKHQKRCAREECRRASNRKKVRKWMKLHPGYVDQAKARAWAKAYPNYWSQYRRAHPLYARRDNLRRAASLRKQRCSAKLTSIRVIAVDKLERIESLSSVNCSAKLTERDRRVEGILQYLFWTVKEPCSAKITHNDLGNRLEVE